jgi:hypothetical protein
MERCRVSDAPLANGFRQRLTCLGGFCSYHLSIRTLVDLRQMERSVTTQVPDILTWNGLVFAIRSEPLDPYIRMTDIDLAPSGAANSACWRGYTARWEVNRDRLYLVDIEGISASDPLSLADMFSGFGQRVFAHWFTGVIIISLDHQVIQPPSDGHFGCARQFALSDPLGAVPAAPFGHMNWKWKELKAELAPDGFSCLLQVRDGQVIEPRSDGHFGYLTQLARSYEDYAPALSDLSEQITIPEIEARAMASDPLGAVPAAPFGHMNWKWEEFKAELAPDAAVWRFSCIWGGSHVHGGYASVARKRIGRFILTSIREIDG